MASSVGSKSIPKPLNIYAFNATGLRTKLDDFNSHFSVGDYDALCICETNFNDGILDREILRDKGYSIHRRDRDNTISSKQDGGGTMCAISNKFTSKRRKDLETLMEVCWVELIISKQQSVFIGCVYIPPKTQRLFQSPLEETLQKVSLVARPDDTIIMMGDYNMSGIKWDASEDGVHAIPVNGESMYTIGSNFLDTMDSFELKQFNSLPTHSDSTLDLVFCNKDDVYISAATKSNTSTHEPLEVTIDINYTPPVNKQKRSVYNYKKADFPTILHILSLMYWGNFDNFSVHEAFSHFYDILYAVLKDNVPVIDIKPNDYPIWYSHELIRLIKSRDKVREKFVKHGRDKNSVFYHDFSSLRAEVKRKQKTCYKEYLTDLASQMQINPKRFWGYANSTSKSGKMPTVMHYKGVQLSSTSTIANAFNQFFHSVFNSNAYSLPYCKFINVPMFKISVITAEQVKKHLLSLKRNTSSGYDNVSAFFLIKCADVLCEPLAQLFNLSIKRGVYPDVLKRNNIIPIHKKEDKTGVVNYRGISMEPIIAKLFERIVNDKLRHHLKPLITPEQHGFMPGRSTSSNLACYVDFISNCLDNKHEVHSIYTDFKKAFDVVPHNLLLHKLCNQFGIQGTMLKWFQSYLSDRYQRVLLNGYTSDWTHVLSGVPQGSVLGPTLFLMFINDLPSVLNHSNSLLFADDAKVFKQINCTDDCARLQADILSLSNWCITWGISLNLDKCFFINFNLKRKNVIDFIYRIYNEVLPCVNEITDLGVVFTTNLSFKTHINHTVSKCLKTLGYIKRITKPFSDPKLLISLYCAFIRSRIEYCSVVWSPSTQVLIDKCEQVQRKFVRFLTYKIGLFDKYTYSYTQMCKFFGLQSLQTRRNISDVCWLNKIVTSSIDCAPLLSCLNFRVPQRLTRNKDIFSVKARINVRKNSTLPRLMNAINKSQLDISLTPVVFKTRAREYYNN